VLANGAAATGLLAFHMLRTTTPLAPRLTPSPAQPLAQAVIYAVIAHYAACQGDTWSSEIGVLAASPPRLIIGLRTVKAGTNGGVTVLGTLAAIGSGAVLGLFIAAANFVVPTPAVDATTIVFVSTIASWAGTVIDSVLGQFLQFSGVAADGVVVNAPGEGVAHASGRNVLSNNGVNLATAAIVTFMAGGQFITASAAGRSA
jgi:uncharacterized membrane protein